jgi:hypothetical protein
VGDLLVRSAFPSGFTPTPPRLSADLDGDGKAETLSIVGNSARILQGSQVAWQSPPGWQVKQALIADLTHDGQLEAVLLVWRPHRDWPIDQYIPHPGRIAGFQDAHGQTCQIILIGWRRSTYKEVWAGSALAEPVDSMAAIPARSRGDDLISLNGRYDEPAGNPARTLTVWDWNGFGFSTLATQVGIFSRVQPGSNPDSAWYLLAD